MWFKIHALMFRKNEGLYLDFSDKLTVPREVITCSPTPESIILSGVIGKFRDWTAVEEIRFRTEPVSMTHRKICSRPVESGTKAWNEHKSTQELYVRAERIGAEAEVDAVFDWTVSITEFVFEAEAVTLDVLETEADPGFLSGQSRESCVFKWQ